jgi:DNA topoisomerase-1
MEELCEVCGSPQVRIVQFKKRPRAMCLNPECPTKQGPKIVVAAGGCPTGDGGDLVVHYSPVGSRYVRCTNYETCKTSFPLPQQGDIEPTGETCECGTPKVIVHTRKGPWTICIDPSCPLKPPAPSRGAKRGTRAGTRTATRRAGSRSSGAGRTQAPRRRPSEGDASAGE